MNPYSIHAHPVEYATWERIKTFGLLEFVSASTAEQIINETMVVVKDKGAAPLTRSDIAHDVLHRLQPDAKKLRELINKMGTVSQRVQAIRVLEKMGL